MSNLLKTKDKHPDAPLIKNQCCPRIAPPTPVVQALVRAISNRGGAPRPRPLSAPAAEAIRYFQNGVPV